MSYPHWPPRPRDFLALGGLQGATVSRVMIGHQHSARAFTP